MVFAFAAGEHFLDIVEAADEAWAQTEALGAERFSPLPRSMDGVQTRAEDLIHDRLEREMPFPALALQRRNHVIVERQGCAHILMISR